MGTTEAATKSTTCHSCDAPIDGDPSGHGILLFRRGDDIAREQLPLCERCALAIGIHAWSRLAEQEEEG